MTRRRRILLLALLPTTLGIATLGGFLYASGSDDEAPAPIPMVQGAASRIDGLTSPAEKGTAQDSAEVSVAQPAASEPKTAPTAPADTAAPNDAPAKSEHAEVTGATLLAHSAAPVAGFDSFASPPSYNSFRIASFAGASGSGSRGSAGAGDHVESDDGVGGDQATSTGGTSESTGRSDVNADQPATGDPSGNSSKEDDSNQNPDDDADGPNANLPPTGPDPGYYPPIFENPPSDEPVLPHVSVPEPASIGLLVLGLLGVTFGRRKRT